MRVFKFEGDYDPNYQSSFIMPIIPITFANKTNNSKIHKKPKNNPKKESRDEKIQKLATLIYREFVEKGSLSDEFLRSIS
tara:strand:+ start:151 stop:390 length:240 start_codon:yes stop_codon:yes gene_type:complete